ncbi:hypothetical protein [Bradyrhizobium sp. CCBAU 051011]
MSSEQLAARVISEQTEIPSYDIRRGDIDETTFGKVRLPPENPPAGATY